jgi:4-azaleucine resistance transporter AzlC
MVTNSAAAAVAVAAVAAGAIGSMTIDSPIKQDLKAPVQLHKVFRQGVTAAWPICLGYMPIGMAFGVLAQKAGLTPLEIGLMSVLVFAGSSQFIAVAMLSAGASFITIVATTFTVNLRHLLMSSALASFLKGRRRGKLSLFAYGITDESFAINWSRLKKGDWDLERAIVLNQTANFVWFASTILGGLGGQFIPANAFGLDYALIAMFICLLVYQLGGRLYVFTALLAGAMAVILALLWPGNGYIIVAAIAAASAGAVLKRRFEGQPARSPLAEEADG